MLNQIPSTRARISSATWSGCSAIVRLAWIELAETYDTLLSQSFGFKATAASGAVQGYGKAHQDMVALQKKTIALAKKQAGDAKAEEDGEAAALLSPRLRS